MPATVPRGFEPQRSGTGLLVPTAWARTREVLTKDDRRALERAIKRVLGPHAMRFAFECAKPECPAPKIQKVNNVVDGSYTLRCGCTDRILQGAF